MLHLIEAGDFPQVYEIMEQSFPKEEYRPYDSQRDLLKKKEYKIYGTRDDTGRIIGFLAIWELPGLLFIEHFAVRKECRNCGIGSELLQSLLERYSSTACLEVELPQNTLTKRRIAFYERNGFALNEFPYKQPSLGDGREPVPLRIMTTGGHLSPKEFQRCKTLLYTIVYGVEA